MTKHEEETKALETVLKVAREGRLEFADHRFNTWQRSTMYGETYRIKPELVPWTQNTFPMPGPVWVRMKAEMKGETKIRMVTGYDELYVYCRALVISWPTLKELYEYSLNGKDWLPCGVIGGGE